MTKILVRMWFKDEFYFEKICMNDFQYCPDTLISKHGPIICIIIDTVA